MHKSLLLPFIGCSVVAVLLFLSSSQRLAAQLSPEQISPELRKQIEEKIEKLEKSNKESDRLKKEWERLDLYDESHDPLEFFIRNPVEGLLGLAVFGVIIGFAVWARIAKRRQERCLALLGAMLVMGIALVAGAAYRHLS